MAVVTKRIVATIVVLALVATLLLDFLAEPRPKGGWLFHCRASRSLRDGTISARRLIAEHGEGQLGDDVVTWAKSDIGRADMSIAIAWYAGRRGRPAHGGSLNLSLRKLQYGMRYGRLALQRIGDDAQRPALVPAPYSPGEFPLEDVFAFAKGDDMLAWSYVEGSGAVTRQASGTIDLAQLREAAAAVPGIERSLDAKAASYATACDRQPASRPDAVIF